MVNIPSSLPSSVKQPTSFTSLAVLSERQAGRQAGSCDRVCMWPGCWPLGTHSPPTNIFSHARENTHLTKVTFHSFSIYISRKMTPLVNNTLAQVVLRNMSFRARVVQCQAMKASREPRQVQPLRITIPHSTHAHNSLLKRPAQGTTPLD